MRLWKRNLIKAVLLGCCLAFSTAASAQNQNSAVAANQSTGHWVLVGWTAEDPMYAVTGYNVYRSTTSGSGYTMLNATPLPNIRYRDDSVTHGTTYYYVVTAINGSGESDMSSEVSATP